MKRVHNIRFSALSKDSAERESLKSVFKSMIGREELPFEEEDLKESGMDTIHALHLTVDKQPSVKPGLAAVIDAMPKEQREELSRQVDSRIDARGNFWFRLEKQALLKGESRFAERGDVVQVRMSVAAFPKNKDNVRRVVLELLGANL